MPQEITIEIRSRREGFRRCGVAHSRVPTWYAATAFTPEQWGILKTEPMLTVSSVPPCAIAVESEPVTRQTEGSAPLEAKRAEPKDPPGQAPDEAVKPIETEEVSAELETEAEENRARRILEATRVPQLKKELTHMGVDIPARVTKSDLVELILANTAPVPENEEV